MCATASEQRNLKHLLQPSPPFSYHTGHDCASAESPDGPWHLTSERIKVTKWMKMKNYFFQMKNGNRALDITLLWCTAASLASRVMLAYTMAWCFLRNKPYLGDTSSTLWRGACSYWVLLFIHMMCQMSQQAGGRAIPGPCSCHAH